MNVIEEINDSVIRLLRRPRGKKPPRIELYGSEWERFRRAVGENSAYFTVREDGSRQYQHFGIEIVGTW